MIRRFHDAARRGDEWVTCWGTGTPRREFLHVDDVADACVFLLKTYSGEGHLNIGTGSDITVAELANAVAAVTGYAGRIDWDSTKPDGTMRKVMDVTRLTALGWRASIPLAEGLRSAYRWFLEHGTVRT